MRQDLEVCVDFLADIKLKEKMEHTKHLQKVNFMLL